MLSRMSDPQQPAHNPHQVPPYVSQPQTTGYPGQFPQQQQTHAVPQQTTEGYVLNGQPSHPGGPSARSGNPAGRAGLILGIIAIAITIVNNIVLQVLIRTSEYSAYSVYGLVSGVGALLAFAAALAALTLGIVGVRRIGAPHAVAGIAIGIGIAEIVGIGFSFLVNTIGSFLYF